MSGILQSTCAFNDMMRRNGCSGEIQNGICGHIDGYDTIASFAMCVPQQPGANMDDTNFVDKMGAMFDRVLTPNEIAALRCSRYEAFAVYMESLKLRCERRNDGTHAAMPREEQNAKLKMLRKEYRAIFPLESFVPGETVVNEFCAMLDKNRWS